MHSLMTKTGGKSRPSGWYRKEALRIDVGREVGRDRGGEETGGERTVSKGSLRGRHHVQGHLIWVLEEVASFSTTRDGRELKKKRTGTYKAAEAGKRTEWSGTEKGQSVHLLGVSCVQESPLATTCVTVRRWFPTYDGLTYNCLVL